jgi:hypothetical protein
MGLRAGLDDVEKTKYFTLPGLELPPLGRPARSQSLYRLRYPGYCRGKNLKKGKFDRVLNYLSTLP